MPCVHFIPLQGDEVKAPWIPTRPNTNELLLRSPAGIGLHCSGFYIIDATAIICFDHQTRKPLLRRPLDRQVTGLTSLQIFGNVMYYSVDQHIYASLLEVD